ncbi:TIGR04141 family sporadically distributed protein [Streptococcus tangpeifui]|uniref:TIGR04141 family sporadically distributed protein n=1 Tax=Streptococcus tangpeifui TaxID=2709400 RepID=UPI001F1518E3|nr:TIGR04141 family sporadically distributed protein [Streptococcus sp. ZJ1593]
MGKKSTQISLFLHSESVKSFQECLKDNLKYQEYELRQDVGMEGKIFVHEPNSNLPSWSEELGTLSKTTIPFQPNTSNKAVVILRTLNRYFSLTYGYGRSMLRDSTIIRNFGLKTVANLIDSQKIRSMNVSSLEDVIVASQRQSSQYASQDLFNLDFQKDLLQSVSGAPKQENIATFLAGTDSLVATRKMDILEIKDNIEFYYNSYKKDDYKTKGFAWLDNIQEVKDKSLKNQLNNHLEQKIIDREFPIIAPNAIIDWNNVEGFYISGSGNRKKTYSIEIDYKDYFEKLISKERKSSFIEVLKRHKLVAKYIREDGEVKIDNIYSSLVFELELDNLKYILCYGSWYKIDADFYSSIKGIIDEDNLQSSIIIPDAKEGENEGDYNERISKDCKNFHLLDKRTYRSAGYGRSSVEVADVITDDFQLIHVKKGGSSSKLSHLFAQGAVSASILAQDNGMKKFINGQINQELIPVDSSNEEFEIVFAIIDKRVNDDTKNSDILPFFSMVNLSNTINQLKSMGFKYSILKIPITDS